MEVNDILSNIALNKVREQLLSCCSTFHGHNKGESSQCLLCQSILNVYRGASRMGYFENPPLI